MVQFATRRSHLPILFHLRTPDAVSDLLELMSWLGDHPKERRSSPFLLFIDGYDEITVEERKKVSSALVDFRALKRGNFYLTCRSYYDIYDLSVIQYHLASFSSSDAVGFVRTFTAAFGVDLNPEELVQELRLRELTNFVEHPLMLALVCILKTGPSPKLPNTTLSLVKRAIDTLTFRWDLAKGINRPTDISLDGEQRVECLKNIAFSMPRLEATDWELIQYIQSRLKRMQVTGIDPRQLLLEMAQWYGLLVPVESDRWTFAHRTIQDYLWARYIVEAGMFHPANVSVWEIRHAYAASLQPDATKSITLALGSSKDLIAFSECLANKAVFEVSQVTHPLFDHFHKYGGFECERLDGSLRVHLSQNFFRFASSEFIDEIISEATTQQRGHVADMLIGYALWEKVLRRKEGVIGGVLKERLIGRFGTPRFRISISQEGGQSGASFSLAECIDS
jgi:hypothetical protein